MTMSVNVTNKRELIRLLDILLLPAGFVRSKEDWYLDNRECVAVIGLGKSLYGGQFGLGIDLLLKELRPELLPFPPCHLCHFRGLALEFLLPDGERLKAALNLENDLSSAVREEVISNAITKYAVPFVLPLNSKQVLAQEIKTNEDFKPYCRLELKLALERDGYLSHADWKLDL